MKVTWDITFCWTELVVVDDQCFFTVENAAYTAGHDRFVIFLVNKDVLQKKDLEKGELSVFSLSS